MHHLSYSTALSKPSKTNKMKFCQDIINNNYSCRHLILEHPVYICQNPMRALYLIFYYQKTSSLTSLLHYLSVRTLYLAISYKILDSFHVLCFPFEILELVPNCFFHYSLSDFLMTALNFIFFGIGISPCLTSFVFSCSLGTEVIVSDI